METDSLISEATEEKEKRILEELMEKYGESSGQKIKKALDIIRKSKTALTYNEIEEKYKNGDNGNGLGAALTISEEIKKMTLSEIRKKYELRRIFFKERPREVYYFINLDQIKNIAKKSPYYTKHNDF